MPWLEIGGVVIISGLIALALFLVYKIALSKERERKAKDQIERGKDLAQLQNARPAAGFDFKRMLRNRRK